MARLDNGVVAICNNSQFETLSQYATNPIMRRCRILQKSHNEKMSNEVKDSKLVIIPKVKHSFLIEAPEQIANNLIEFIENI